MRNTFCLLLLCLTTITFGQAVNDTTRNLDQLPIETMVDEMPSFAGGEKELQKFLNKNLVTPPSAKQKKLRGSTYIKFIINKDGSIGSTKAIKPMDNCPECDEEALRVVRSFPKWNPAKKGGQPVTAPWNIKIDFR